MQALGVAARTDAEFLRNFLDERASTEMERVKLRRERVEALKDKVILSPDDADLKSDLSDQEGQQAAAIQNLQKAVQMMDELEFDTAGYQQFLIEATGEITTDILDKDVAVSVIQQWIERTRSWFEENGPGLAFKSLFILAIIAAFIVLSTVVRRVVRRTVESPRLNFSQLVRRMIVTISANIVLFLGFLVALSQMGVSLGPVLAGLGIAGFVIGFALQEVLGNFAAGLMILIYRPFDVGDMIEAAGVFGKVHAMSIVSTSIMTIDNQTLIVPNGKIWGDVIKNVTGQETRRIDMTFGISYSDDIPHTEKVLKAILDEHSKVLEDPEPVVRLHTLGESSVDFVVRPWVNTGDYWEVYWDITREVKMRFDKEGISIPFPQRDVHLHQVRRQEGKAESGTSGATE